MIGTHGSYASPSGCSTGTTQTTFSTAMPEVSSTDRANGLVIRAYVWETGTKVKTVNIDLATVTGSTPYNAFTAYEIQAVDDTSGTPATAPWPLATVDATTYTDATNWPSATPATTKYLKLDARALRPDRLGGHGRLADERLARLGGRHERRHPLLLPRDLQRRDLARHARQRRLAASRARTAGRSSRATPSPCRR